MKRWGKEGGRRGVRKAGCQGEQKRIFQLESEMKLEMRRRVPSLKEKEPSWKRSKGGRGAFPFLRREVWYKKKEVERNAVCRWDRGCWEGGAKGDFFGESKKKRGGRKGGKGRVSR